MPRIPVMMVMHQFWSLSCNASFDIVAKFVWQDRQLLQINYVPLVAKCSKRFLSISFGFAYQLLVKNATIRNHESSSWLMHHNHHHPFISDNMVHKAYKTQIQNLKNSDTKGHDICPDNELC
jgi:hypothetical protein